MKNTFIALATAATITASGAFADAHSEVTMGEGLTMFETLVMNQMAELNVEADVSMLTLGQLNQIKNIIESDVPSEEKKRRVETIIH